MKKVVIILLFLWFFKGFSQEKSNNEIIDFQKAYQLRDIVSSQIDKQQYDSIPALLNQLKRAYELKVDTVSAMISEVHAKYFYYTGAYERSANYLIEAAKVYKKMNDSLGASMMYSNIAELLAAAKSKPKEQLKYRYEALELCPERLNANWHITLLHNLGISYFERDQLDSSTYFLKLAFDKSKAEDYRLITGSSYVQFAKHSMETSHYQDAIAYVDTLIIYYKNDVPIEVFQEGMINKARAHFNIGKFNEAERDLMSFKNDALTANLESISDLLAKVYEKQGRFEDAYFEAQTAQRLKDSIFNLEKQLRLIELQEQYDNEKKENENLLLKQESTQKDLALATKNNWILTIAVFAFALIAAIIYFWNRRVLKEKERRNQTEQQLRRAQINPHFFFNVLTSIQQKVLSSSEKKDSVRYISKFARLMRQTLETSFNDFVDIDEEVMMLENYIQLQKIRYKSKFEYEIKNNCEDAIAIPTQIVQPFVENAIEHGFKNINHTGQLKVIFSTANDQVLKAEVIDNGSGIESDMKKKNHTSRAIQIIQERLRLFKDETKYFHDISTGSHGTHITIFCPYQ